MLTFLGILLLLFIIWFWLDSARAREIATGICQYGCEQRGVQFLDQTVALSRIGIHWTSYGIRFKRLFRFDFSEEGVGRRSGYIHLVGIQMIEFSLGLPSSEETTASVHHIDSR